MLGGGLIAAAPHFLLQNGLRSRTRVRDLDAKNILRESPLPASMPSRVRGIGHPRHKRRWGAAASAPSMGTRGAST